MASNGWLNNFKKHHGNTFKTVQSEAGVVDLQSLLEWQQQVLQPLLRHFSADDVFNLDKTGLFSQLLPNKIFEFQRRMVHWRKEEQAKDHSSGRGKYECHSYFECPMSFECPKSKQANPRNPVPSRTWRFQSSMKQTQKSGWQ